MWFAVVAGGLESGLWLHYSLVAGLSGGKLVLLHCCGGKGREGEIWRCWGDCRQGKLAAWLWGVLGIGEGGFIWVIKNDYVYLLP